jgi:SAM-dependent methyltransferase
MAASKFRHARRMVNALVDPGWRQHLLASLMAYEKVQKAECASCGFSGKFLTFLSRPGAQCPACGGRERHRLLALAVQRGFIGIEGREILHFAPEPSVTKILLRLNPASYTTADIQPGRADRVLDLERIALPDSSCDLVVVSHVLEHVDDGKALSELHRILRPRGQVIAMIPIVEAWPRTYENPSITDEDGREAHFGQYDHVRYYGADFRDRVRNAGFDLAEFTANGEDSARYGLLRGEKVFLASK